MTELNFNHTLDLDDLAYEMAFCLDIDDLVNFVVDLDERVAEVEFTKAVIDRLQATLEEEDTDELPASSITNEGLTIHVGTGTNGTGGLLNLEALLNAVSEAGRQMKNQNR